MPLLSFSGKGGEADRSNSKIRNELSKNERLKPEIDK